MGKAEEHQEWMSLQLLIGHRPAVLIGQLKRSPDGSRPGCELCRPAAENKKDGAECQHGRGHERAQTNQQAESSSRHGLEIRGGNHYRQAASPARIISWK